MQRWSPAICALALCVPGIAQVSVDESATRARLVHHTTTVSLAVRNNLNKPLQARMDLEWLDPDGRRCGNNRQSTWTAPPGDSTFETELPLSDQGNPLMYRLHYRMAAGPENLTAFFPEDGMLSFSHIADHAYRLTAIGIGTARAGRSYEMRILASHPINNQPAAGVLVATGHNLSAITDANGIALLKLTPDPEEWKDAERISIRGRRGDLVQRMDAPLPDVPPNEVHIQTDKPLYQPGQTLHMRMLAFGADGRARAGGEYSIRIRDERSTMMHSVSVKTSRFGIAHTDWIIPANARSGEYRIEATDEENDSPAIRKVEVRRYELPSFRVSVQPDRPFYLPGQNAAIEIRADYLFGKAVTTGKVRISESQSDEPLREGVFDSSARFRTEIDLKKPVEAMEESDRYVDLHYTAYVTDESTRRTEERRFDLRLSRHPVHIYVIGDSGSGTLGRRLYIATYTPDGRPAIGDVEALSNGRRVGATRTNRLGLARLEISNSGEELVIRAGTATQRAAEAAFSPHVVLETDKSLYRTGQPVHCRIVSDRKDLRLFLLAWREDGTVVYSHAGQLHDGHSLVTIPFDPRFGPVVSIGVFSALGTEYEMARTILYPGAEALRISARSEKNTHKPGERASLGLRAFTGTGDPVEAAFGVAIVDQSVLERVATDEHGRPRQSFADESGEMSVGGITRQDLLNLDPAKIDDDLQLAAEMLLNSTPISGASTRFAEEQRAEFSRPAKAGLSQVRRRLDDAWHQTLDYPRDAAALHSVAGHILAMATDPWLHSYRPQFSTEGAHDVLRLVSAGPDKLFGTQDDFTALEIRREWFFPFKAVIKKALDALEDYPASADDFIRVLRKAGVSFESLRDPWHNPLRVTISHMGAARIISLESPGPDHVFGTRDDFDVIEYRGSFFRGASAKIRQAIEAAREFPHNEAQLRALLSSASVNLDQERDPSGRPYYTVFRGESRFTDQVQVYTYSEYLGRFEERKKMTPTKHAFLMLEIRSVGKDGVRGTYDDFSVAEFSRELDEDKPLPEPVPQREPAVTIGGTGAITGIVSDPTGAVIPNAIVILNEEYQTRCDPNGRYYFRGLPAGVYSLTFSSAGFRNHVIAGVPVQPGRITRADSPLYIGDTSQTVEVTAQASQIDTQMSSMVANVTSTPRIREDFPETLLWEPELVTGRAGIARLDVKLADSITTWNVAITASTADGRVTATSTELHAFQPFFADLDPPRVLTAGDEIKLPVPIRNYLATDQNVSVDMTAPPALSIANEVRRTERVAASSSANVVVHLRAIAAAPEARLRVLARAKAVGDAIEKPISIHPDGQPVTFSVSDLLDNSRVLRIHVPAGVIPGSTRAEVKVYPTLVAGVIESLGAIPGNPTGCAEQTISSSYPNLLLLRALKAWNLHDDALESRARRNLENGYQRLLGFQDDGGGFRYWDHDDPDIALTSYAITFLSEARNFVVIDDSVLESAQSWLGRQQTRNTAVHGISLRALARAGPKYESLVLDHLAKLARTAAEIGDPYAISAFALAALDVNRPELARAAVVRLRGLARSEEGTEYWDLRGNTPFHGWGRAGRIETTALALSALSRWRRHAGDDPQLASLIDHGALFLLRSRDKSGLWLSTQATIRVLEALLDAFPARDDSQAFAVEIRMNGASAGRIPVPAGRTIQGPVAVDVSRFVKPGVNELSFSAPAGHATTQIQFAAEWYQRWTGPKTSHELGMTARYSIHDTSPNQPVRCDITISRPAFRGYGMMIAEIGLPPGADVDRGTLTDLLEDRNSGVDSFEVAPDRVIFYVWPRAEDSKIRFTFRPRYPIHALTAPAVLYDYYNPDARVILPPEMFSVR